MPLEPKKRFINPGDQDEQINAMFTLADLKLMQGVLVREMERVAKDENAIYEDQRLLSQKLEYLISEFDVD